MRLRDSKTIETKVFQFKHASDYAIDALHFIQHILRAAGGFISPFAAPSTGGFGRSCPTEARQGCRAFSEGYG
jgi:hypothetical protein